MFLPRPKQNAQHLNSPAHEPQALLRKRSIALPSPLSPLPSPRRFGLSRRRDFRSI